MIARPERLSAGDMIVIPRPSELDPAQVRPANSRPTAASARPSAPAPNPTAVTRPNAALVQPGPSGIRAGSRRATVDRDQVDGSDARSAPYATSDHAAPRRAPPYHIVRRYETLRSIARDRLGDSRRADEIIELNRDRLGESDQLKPGLPLVLPPDAATERQSP
jgi:nucleoid-associated protein YgaU